MFYLKEINTQKETDGEKCKVFSGAGVVLPLELDVVDKSHSLEPTYYLHKTMKLPYFERMVSTVQWWNDHENMCMQLSRDGFELKFSGSSEPEL